MKWSLLLGLALATTACADYHPGDFIPTARKGQFQSVALPIPRPVGFMGDEEYKMQFSFEGERHITPWVTVLPPLKKMNPDNPMMLHLRMGHDANHLRSAKVAVEPVPAFYVKKHHAELAEFYNASHWPKHLLVKYSWHAVVEVDANAGLTMLLMAGLATSALVIYAVVSSHAAYINKFMSDTLAEDDGAGDEKGD